MAIVDVADPLADALGSGGGAAAARAGAARDAADRGHGRRVRGLVGAVRRAGPAQDRRRAGGRAAGAARPLGRHHRARPHGQVLHRLQPNHLRRLQFPGVATFSLLLFAFFSFLSSGQLGALPSCCCRP